MPNYITHSGYEKIQKEIENLQKQLQDEIPKKIAEAASLGDLKENAEYQSMKDKQHLVARRLEDLGQLISGAQIIEHLDLPHDQVTVGKKVHLRNLDNDRLDVYIILGPVESDIDNDIISYDTPVARQIMLKKEGEVVDVTVPAGILKYKIEKIESYTAE